MLVGVAAVSFPPRAHASWDSSTYPRLARFPTHHEVECHYGGRVNAHSVHHGLQPAPGWGREGQGVDPEPRRGLQGAGCCKLRKPSHGVVFLGSVREGAQSTPSAWHRCHQCPATHPAQADLLHRAIRAVGQALCVQQAHDVQLGHDVRWNPHAERVCVGERVEVCVRGGVRACGVCVLRLRF